MKKIGLSLSPCVKDILDGKVPMKKVSKIIASTAFPTMEEAINFYYPIAWKEHPKEEVIRVMTILWPIVYQPRLEAKGHPKFTVGNHWVKDENTIQYTI